MEYIVDIETDGLDATLVHCIVAANVDEPTDIHVWEQTECYTTFPVWIKEMKSHGHKLVGHSFISYDAPTLNRLVGTDIKLTDIIDTLVMSYIGHPSRDDGHGLESWGVRFGYPKTVIEDDEWGIYTPKILERCKRDVTINWKTYQFLKQELSGTPSSVYWREARVREIVDQQQRNGFCLDIPAATILFAKLEDQADELNDTLQEVFPPRWVFKKDKGNDDLYVPKRDNKTLGYTKDCAISRIEWQVFNMQSGPQLATRLMEKGWVPVLFTETGLPCTDEGVLNSINAELIPEAKPIQRFLMLKKRMSQITGWLEAVTDKGLVHGSVITNGAVTSRMTHREPNMANITSSDSEYGTEMRACWISRDPHNYVLVGVDATGLELRCLAGCMGDTLYSKEVVTGDVHTVNMHALGITDRAIAKTFIYAWLYGAGAGKIAKILGCTMKKAQLLIAQFLVTIPSLKKLKDQITEAAKSKRIVALDGRFLHVRATYSALNVLLQGMGAIICKEWLIQIIDSADKAGLDYLLVASVHDEYQFEVNKRDVDKFREVSHNAMKLTEQILNVKCPLDSDSKVGINWSITH